MRVFLGVLSLTAVVGIPIQAAAQVYESEDAEGHPVYSDQPSPGATPVQIPATNTSDHVDATPGPAPAKSVGNETSPPQRGTPEYEQKIEQEMTTYRRVEAERERARHSEQRHKVGHDGREERHKVGDAEKRHKVGHGPAGRRY